MKIVYIAHPISGNIEDNLKRITNIIRYINLMESDVVPFAHYFVDCYALDDNNPEERKRGIKNDTEFFKRGFIDELWLYGDRISHGMSEEIKLAHELGILIVPKTENTKKEYFDGWLNPEFQ